VTALPLVALSLAEEVQRESGQDLSVCFQCKICTSGCPLAGAMDLTPHAVMRALQLGREERLLRANSFWLCASCQACTARCPQGIDLAAVMDALRMVATRRRVPAAVPEAPIFTQAAVRSIRLFGRLYEAGVGLEINLRTRRPLRERDGHAAAARRETPPAARSRGACRASPSPGGGHRLLSRLRAARQRPRV